MQTLIVVETNAAGGKRDYEFGGSVARWLSGLGGWSSLALRLGNGSKNMGGGQL